MTDPVQARSDEAPQLHASGNLLKHIKVRKGDMKQGFSESDVVLEQTFHTPIEEHAFLEPECSVAVPTKDGRLEIYVGSQIPYQDRTQVARVLGWPEERIRIVGQLMGGGFGGKEDIAGQIHAALLANATKRPVKLLFDRHESMLVHPKRHATQIRVKMGAKKDGRLHAVETELYGDTGAYASLGDKVMTRATTHSAGPYDIPHVRADCYAMYTNNPPAGAFRGFGVTQSAFAIESMMDMLAETLALDPVEIRRMNALRVGSVTNTGQLLRESVGLSECIEKVAAEMSRIAASEVRPARQRSVCASCGARHAASGSRLGICGRLQEHRVGWRRARQGGRGSGALRRRHAGGAEFLGRDGAGPGGGHADDCGRRTLRRGREGPGAGDGYGPDPGRRTHDRLAADLHDGKCIPPRSPNPAPGHVGGIG